MTTRYVYDKYNSVKNISPKMVLDTSSSMTSGTYYDTNIPVTENLIYGSGNISLVSSTGKLGTYYEAQGTATGSNAVSTISSTTTKTGVYVWKSILSPDRTVGSYISLPYDSDDGTTTKYDLKFFKPSTGYWKVYWTYVSGNSANTRPTMYKYHLSETIKYTQGTTNYGKYTTSASSMSATSSYYYSKLGSDNIDAVSISSNLSTVTVGDTITLTVAPSTTNIYGGTISYLYQYSIDGGTTWLNLTTTTNTRTTMTIPTNTSAYILKTRVRASDNYGFTSSTYTLSKDIPVTVTQTLSLYCKVNGAYKSLSKLFIKDSAMKEITNGYIKINGSWKKN